LKGDWIVENMTDYQYAWMIYLVGAVGCSLATWLLFRRLGRACTHFFVITVMVILFMPYATDAESMTMAPAVYSMVFGYFDGGFASIKPILKVMLGLWAGALVLSLIYQLLTRGHRHAEKQPEPSPRKSQKAYTHTKEQDDYDYAMDNRRASSSSRGLTREERIARNELLHEEPIRAVR
jgi:hypothetical protein